MSFKKRLANNIGRYTLNAGGEMKSERTQEGEKNIGDRSGIPHGFRWSGMDGERVCHHLLPKEVMRREVGGNPTDLRSRTYWALSRRLNARIGEAGSGKNDDRFGAEPEILDKKWTGHAVPEDSDWWMMEILKLTFCV